jgi:hypothetical protein
VSVLWASHLLVDGGLPSLKKKKNRLLQDIRQWKQNQYEKSPSIILLQNLNGVYNFDFEIHFIRMDIYMIIIVVIERKITLNLKAMKLNLDILLGN